MRSEFVEQVLGLRRKVINRIKVKRLAGKALNGGMIATLAG